MRTARIAPWILLGVLASGCHSPVAEVNEQPVATPADERPLTTGAEGESAGTRAGEKPVTTAAGQQPVTTRVEECSWCPAPDPSGTTGAQQPASSSLDLMDQLAAAVDGTAFSDISEDQLLSDIRSVCEEWKGDASLEVVTAKVSVARADLLGVPEPQSGLAAYAGLLESSAEARCLRDPTA